MIVYYPPSDVPIPIGKRPPGIFDKRLELISKLPMPVYLVYKEKIPNQGYMFNAKQLGTVEDGIQCPEDCESFTCSHTQVFISKDLYEDSQSREIIAKAINKSYILGV